MTSKMSENREVGESAKEKGAEKKKWFGRGIYGSKDVPIRLLDGFIAFLILAIVVLTVLFAWNGGYQISFDTGGGNEIPSQKLRHGSFVEEPPEPIKAGYEFAGWYYGVDLEHKWDFAVTKVGGEATLVAKWIPAKVTVKFDLAGGNWADGEPGEYTVIYGETYGKLPEPVRPGYLFDGWIYSGQKIMDDTQVTVNGEHVLTASWKES